MLKLASSQCKANKVDDFDLSLKAVVEQLLHAAKHHKLSFATASQFGIQQNIAVLFMRDGDTIVMINPKIIAGLSTIEVEYQDVHAQSHQSVFTGSIAKNIVEYLKRLETLV